MPKTAIATASQMRAELKTYCKRIHLPLKYNDVVRPFLSGLWKEARRNQLDVWKSLTAHEDVTYKEKVTGSTIKSAFREFLRRPQQGRCCYCRCWLVGNAHARPIEHILPRHTYPQFSLDFWNLAVACADCNLAKTKDVWGTIPPVVSKYPGPSAFHDMYHPRYHAYNDHVSYVIVETNRGGIALYRGLTAQGQHLCLNLLDKIASKRALVEDHPELSESLNDIDQYRIARDRIAAPALHAFADMLDSVLMDRLKG